MSFLNYYFQTLKRCSVGKCGDLLVYKVLCKVSMALKQKKLTVDALPKRSSSIVPNTSRFQKVQNGFGTTTESTNHVAEDGLQENKKLVHRSSVICSEGFDKYTFDCHHNDIPARSMGLELDGELVMYNSNDVPVAVEEILAPKHSVSKSSDPMVRSGIFSSLKLGSSKESRKNVLKHESAVHPKSFEQHSKDMPLYQDSTVEPRVPSPQQNLMFSALKQELVIHPRKFEQRSDVTPLHRDSILDSQVPSLQQNRTFSTLKQESIVHPKNVEQRSDITPLHRDSTLDPQVSSRQQNLVYSALKRESIVHPKGVEPTFRNPVHFQEPVRSYTYNQKPISKVPLVKRDSIVHPPTMYQKHNYQDYVDSAINESDVQAHEVPIKNSKTFFMKRDSVVHPGELDVQHSLCINGRFQNPWPTWHSPTITNILKFGLSKDKSNVPSKQELDLILPVVKPNFVKNLKPPEEGIRITWIGHSTVLVQMHGLNILTDPIFSDRASPSQVVGPKRYRDPPCSIHDLPHIDAVVISHSHYDHLDFNTVRLLNARFDTDIRWFVPSGLLQWMQQLGCENVVELDWWEENCVPEHSDTFFIFTPAQHWSKRTIGDDNKVLWGSWCIIGPKYRFFFAGDTGYCDVFKQIGKIYGPFDLSAIPIGAYEPRWFMKYQHVNPEEAVKLHIDVKSKYSLAIHWGTFCLANEYYLDPPRKLRDSLDEHGIQAECFFTFKHGETRLFTQDSPVVKEKAFSYVSKK